jgi:Pectate lyase superfamily protein/Major tropism determinant N-terminal domain
MAILQISQIQVRRGLNQDLPQLASGEFGWSLDTQQLFIGNGTLAEGAPTVGVTEILTTSSDLKSLLGSYQYKGFAAGYQAVTGVDTFHPILRTLQDKLDDIVDVRDFGALGNGITDDTAAINRAIQNIYLSTLNGVNPLVQRVIHFPAGNYLISSPILVPPNCTLIGAGKNNTIINIAGHSAYSVIATADSLFQYSTSIGLNGAILPSFITILDMGFESTTNINPIMIINSATDVVIERCQFIGGSYSVDVNGSSAVVKLNYCTFSGYTVAPLLIGPTVTGLVSRNDHLDTHQALLTTGTAQITSLTGAGYIDYQLTDSSSNIRFGKLSYSSSNGVTTFTEEYTEPAVSLGANLYVWSGNAALTCTVTNTSTLKYQNKTFT